MQDSTMPWNVPGDPACSACGRKTPRQQTEVCDECGIEYGTGCCGTATPRLCAECQSSSRLSAEIGCVHGRCEAGEAGIDPMRIGAMKAAEGISTETLARFAHTR